MAVVFHTIPVVIPPNSPSLKYQRVIGFVVIVKINNVIIAVVNSCCYLQNSVHVLSLHHVNTDSVLQIKLYITEKSRQTFENRISCKVNSQHNFVQCALQRVSKSIRFVYSIRIGVLHVCVTAEFC